MLAAVVLLLAAACALLAVLAARRAPCTSVQVVVARYSEDLSWLDRPPFKALPMKAVVYDKNDKGDASYGNPPPGTILAPLPNVGREGHTYLYHIVNSYNHLADVTVFLPGSCADQPQKWRKTQWVMQRALDTCGSAFPYVPLRGPLEQRMEGFTIARYNPTNRDNAGANPETRLQPSPVRPFGAWLREHGLAVGVRGVTYQGVFAVSRDHIRRRPREFYARLLSLLEGHSNPEAGHFMERSWLAVFHPVPAGSAQPGDGPQPPSSAPASVASVALALLGALAAARNFS